MKLVMAFKSRGNKFNNTGQNKSDIKDFLLLLPAVIGQARSLVHHVLLKKINK